MKGIATKAAQRVLDSRACPQDLWSSCNEYNRKSEQKPDLMAFRTFRERLGIKNPFVATAATFPAFICPERFPMADKQITRWAARNSRYQSYADAGGPEFGCVPDLRKGVLRESHWPFVCAWIEWCRFTSSRLSDSKGCTWRARDVEMAVFTAQRSNPPLKLNKPA